MMDKDGREHQNKGGLTMNRSTLKQYRSIVDEINDLNAEINELDNQPNLFINLTLDLDTQLEKMRSIRKEIEGRMWRLTSQERRVIRFWRSKKQHSCGAVYGSDEVFFF